MHAEKPPPDAEDGMSCAERRRRAEAHAVRLLTEFHRNDAEKIREYVRKRYGPGSEDCRKRPIPPWLNGTQNDQPEGGTDSCTSQ